WGRGAWGVAWHCDRALLADRLLPAACSLADSWFLPSWLRPNAATGGRQKNRVAKKSPLEMVAYKFPRTHFSAPNFSASNSFHQVRNSAQPFVGIHLRFEQGQTEITEAVMGPPSCLRSPRLCRWL